MNSFVFLQKILFNRISHLLYIGGNPKINFCSSDKSLEKEEIMFTIDINYISNEHKYLLTHELKKLDWLMRYGFSDRNIFYEFLYEMLIIKHTL